MRVPALSLCLLLPGLALAETPVEKAQALLGAKDCDQLLLSFENAKAKGGAEDLALAKVLGQAASGPCASDKVVAFSLGTAAARLAPKAPEVLTAAAGAARGAGPRVAIETRSMPSAGSARSICSRISGWRASAARSSSSGPSATSAGGHASRPLPRASS